jgi:putative transposase
MSWCAEKGITLLFVQPEKPQHNAFIERFNPTEVLNACLFKKLREIREKTEGGTTIYNEERLHRSREEYQLGGYYRTTKQRHNITL